MKIQALNNIYFNKEITLNISAQDDLFGLSIFIEFSNYADNGINQ